MQLHTVSSTFAIRTSEPHRPKIAKEFETLQAEKNYFFKSPLRKILKTLPHNPTQKRSLTMKLNKRKSTAKQCDRKKGSH